MKYLLLIATIWVGAAQARVEVTEDMARCELALVRNLPFTLELDPDAGIDLLDDLEGFRNTFPGLLEFAVPSPGAKHPLTFQTLYVQNKQFGGMLHVEFRRVSADVVSILRVRAITKMNAEAFYGTVAYFYDLEPINFDFAADDPPLVVGENAYQRIKMNSVIQAKIWVKHRLNLDDILRILAKVHTARPVQNPGASAAQVFYRRVRHQLYFFALYDSIYLRTIYPLEPSPKKR